MARLDNGIKLTRPPKIRNVLNNQRLKKAEEKLRQPHGPHDEQYTPMQFLRAARHTFTMSNRSYFKQLEETIVGDPEIGGDIESEDDEDTQVTIFIDNYSQLVENDLLSISQAELPTNAAVDTPNIPTPQLTQECYICMDQEANTALIPCGHKGFCYDCANVILHNESEDMPPPPKCPKCRVPITQILKIYD